MRTFVFTYNRFDTLTTPSVWEAEGLDHIVLCHDDEARDRFVEAGRVNPDRLVATGEPKGLANNRNAALEMMETDEWALFMVDDLKSLSEVADYDTRPQRALGIDMDNQREFPRSMMQSPISATQFVERAHELARVCDAMDSRLGGFCGIANPIFRDRHWRFNVLADGRAWVVKKSSLRFDTGAQMIDDVCWNAQNIQRFGVVVVNQWVLPDCERYTAGSFGSIDERMEQKLREAAHLTSTYPGLITTKRKAGWPDGSHVVLRRTLDRRTREELERTALEASRR
jgi:hypothetical protein